MDETFTTAGPSPVKDSVEIHSQQESQEDPIDNKEGPVETLSIRSRLRSASVISNATDKNSTSQHACCFCARVRLT